MKVRQKQKSNKLIESYKQELFSFPIIAFDLLLSRTRDCPHDCNVPVRYDATVRLKNEISFRLTGNLSYQICHAKVYFTDRFHKS